MEIIILRNNFITHNKAMSISNSINHKIVLPTGSHTSKKKAGSINKVINDLQRNLIKESILKNENFGNLE